MRSLIPRAAARAAAFADGRGLPGSILRGLTALLLLVALAGTGVAGAAAAGASTTAAAARAGQCTRTVTGTHHGALVAGRGVLCLDHATQDGPVRVRPGAGLQVTASVISGAVTAARSRSVRVCGSTVIGPVRIDGAAGPVTAGDAGASCRGDTIHGRLVITGSAGRVRVAGLRQQGPVTLSGNTAGLTLSGASVGGTVTVRGNRGRAPVVIAANAVSGSLACAANRPAPGDRRRPNTVSGTAGGQCRTLVPPRKLRQPGSPLAQDLSGTLPNLNYGQAVGDFTGVGHDESAYVENGQLVIANPNKFGGQVVRSTPTDLQATPNEGFTTGVYPEITDWPVWRDGNDSNGATYHMTSVKVAANASAIYMAGATWGADNPVGTYQLHLYKLPHDGSCASASCADATTVDLPPTYNVTTNMVVPTSLAVGMVGGLTLIAVGLSDYGILIFRDDGSSLTPVANLTDMGVGGSPPTQTPVTALAFGPPSVSGQGGLLAAGVESPGNTMFIWRLTDKGTESSLTADSGWLPGDAIMAAAFAQINGQTTAVFTRSDGDVLALLPGNDQSIVADLPPGQRTGQPTGLTAVTPPDGDAGNQELVVGKLGGTGDQVLQWANGALQAVPIGQGGTTTGTNDQVEAWYPGYAAGRLRVANNSAGPVDIAMASRQDPGYGCWLNAPVTGPPAVPAFPDADTPLAAGATSPDYFAGALTAGATGDCASALPGTTGERAAYVVITPAGDPADEHVVKLVAGTDGTLSIPRQTGQPGQVGGYLSASLSQVSPGPGSLGTWQLTVTGGSTRAASTTPTVKGYRLTAAPDPANYQPPKNGPAADDPCRPVYRFDVTGAQWTNVAEAGQQTAQIPAMSVQGSSDGGQTWTDLGRLMPATAPAVAADGTVTLGPASFFFQNAPGTATAQGVWTAGQPSQCPATGNPPVTEVRVVSGGQPPAVVQLDTLTAPPLDSHYATSVTGVQVVPDDGGGAAAMPLADGVDQAGLTLQLVPGSGTIERNDPRYSLVYYRDDTTHALVTGLYQPGGYADYTAVGPYAADGKTGEPDRNWLVTTSTAPENLDAVLNDSGTINPDNSSGQSQPFKVTAYNNPLTPAGTATGGIGITGCTSSPTGTCTLAGPTATAPALYQAGPDQNGNPVTGLQFSATAITSPSCLPLQVGTGNAHNLGSATLDVTASQAKLIDTSQFWPTDSVDTALVTAGQLVPAANRPVGNG